MSVTENDLLSALNHAYGPEVSRFRSQMPPLTEKEKLMGRRITRAERAREDATDVLAARIARGHWMAKHLNGDPMPSLEELSDECLFYFKQMYPEEYRDKGFWTDHWQRQWDAYEARKGSP